MVRVGSSNRSEGLGNYILLLNNLNPLQNLTSKEVGPGDKKRQISRDSSGVEHLHGKQGVGGSTPPRGSIKLFKGCDSNTI